MSEAEHGWEGLLVTDAPAECALQAALMTTFDRPDEELIVEHLLPALLRLGREFDSGGHDRNLFFAELDEGLRRLRGRIAVVSSPPRGDVVVRDGHYPWLWQRIARLTTGGQGVVVQHAKLWLFHWSQVEGSASEFLEIVISSTNLTMAAFKHQLQAGWRALIPLNSRATNQRRAGWGVLPSFLAELATSCGGSNVIDGFLDLLGRADCPEKTSFIASVPGQYTRDELRRSPWGLAGLKDAAPVGTSAIILSVLSPYVGSWKTEELNRWCKRIGSRPDKIELVWCTKEHPWEAEKAAWTLPPNSLKTLVESRAALLRLEGAEDVADETGRFHSQHRPPSDTRWSHAKVYGLRRGKGRRLVVTSANFSASAWGGVAADGKVTIRNFELGVVLEGANWPFAGLNLFEDPLAEIATRAPAIRDASSAIGWASAVWDGKVVRLRCRVKPGIAVSGEIVGDKEAKTLGMWLVQRDGVSWSANGQWGDTMHLPVCVRLTAGDTLFETEVLDVRPVEDSLDTPIPEVDEELSAILRDEVIFEEFAAPLSDGPMVPESGSDKGIKATRPVSPPIEEQDKAAAGSHEEDGDGETVVGGDYALPIFEEARRLFAMVDVWAVRMTVAAKNDDQYQYLMRRGGELVGALSRYERRLADKRPELTICPCLAAEELELRLELAKKAGEQ